MNEPASPPSLGDPRMIQLLTDALAKVKMGQIAGMAVVTVTNTGQINWPAQGTRLFDLYMALSILQREIEKTILQSKIIK